MHQPIGETALPSPAANPVRPSKGRKHRPPSLDRGAQLTASCCLLWLPLPAVPEVPREDPCAHTSTRKGTFHISAGSGPGALGQDQESWGWRPLPHLGWVPEWCCWRQRGQEGHKQGTEHGDREQHPQGSRGSSSTSLGGQRDTHLAEG